MNGKLTIFLNYTTEDKVINEMLNRATKKEKVVTYSNSIDASLYKSMNNLQSIIEYRPDLVLFDVLTPSNCDNIIKLLSLDISVFTYIHVEKLIDYYYSSKQFVEIFKAADDIILIEAPQTNQAILKQKVDLILKDRKENIYKSPVSEEHILACLSSSPSNPKIIHTASKLAESLNCKFTALFVQTPEFQNTQKENRHRLAQHQTLARQLGANVETVFGHDIPFQIAEFARINKITKIILGQSATKEKKFPHKESFVSQIISYAPDIDIHIIPDQKLHRYRKPLHKKIEFNVNVLISIFILFVATLLSILFDYLSFTDSNIIMVYILGVLLTSVMTTHRMYSLVSSIASVIIFNFLFTEPRFTLQAYATGYPITFLVMFLTAYITGTFANRYKQHASISAKTAYRTQILFDTNQLISKAKTSEAIFEATSQQLVKLLMRNIVIFKIQDGKLEQPIFYSNEQDSIVQLTNQDFETCQLIFENNQNDVLINDLKNTNYLYLPIRINEEIYGVIGIYTKNNPLDIDENSILLSILGECALALENEKNHREKEYAALLAQSEQLRANLLRMISHDLRSPLTSISGHASNLLNNSLNFDETTKQEIYKDIYNDSAWLTNLVENLLFSTRVEEGKIQLHTSPELLSDILEEVMSRLKSQKENHTIISNKTEDLLFVNVDIKLIVQVILNIIDNAIKYTPKGSIIEINTIKKDNVASISISDNGPGINDHEKKQIFDKFYTGENKTSDTRRSLGLGLYLCKAIVEAHGGSIKVKDNIPNGTIFTFTIPIKEVDLIE